MKNKILPIILVLIVFGAIGCKKNYVLQGSIRGSVVQIYDTAGVQMSIIGLKIELKDSLDKPGVITYTDSYGRFEFDKVYTNSYEIIVADAYTYQFVFVGGEEPLVIPGFNIFLQ